MVRLAPDVKPILPGRHPLLPRQPPVQTISPPGTAGLFMSQLPPGPIMMQPPSAPRFLTPMKESQIDAWRRTTSAGEPSERGDGADGGGTGGGEGHTCAHCGAAGGNQTQSKKSKSAPASLVRSNHPHSCTGSSDADSRSPGGSRAHTHGQPSPSSPRSWHPIHHTPAPLPTGSHSHRSPGERSYYSTKKDRIQRRARNEAAEQAWQSMPYVTPSGVGLAPSTGVADKPPHNWGAEMNYTPRQPAPERVPAKIENNATNRIAGARDPISQKYWRTMFPPPAPM